MRVDPHQFADDLLKDGYTIEKLADGESMLPAIPPGSTVRIIPVANSLVLPGDIVLIKAAAKRFLIHRVSAIMRSRGKLLYQTWGDNNPIPDPAVPRSSILGKVSGYSSDGVTWNKIRSTLFATIRLYLVKYLPYYIKRSVILLIEKIFRQ